MQHNRRQFLTGIGSLVGPYTLLRQVKPRTERQADKSTAAGGTVAAGSNSRIILLGTKGGPPVTKSGRSHPSTLILINDVGYVIDCGYGVSRQLISAGVALDRLRYIFITHHHSDHNLEYGPLLYNAWVTPKPPTIDVYGPAGLQELTRGFFASQKFDIDTRIGDEGMIDLRKLVSVHEFKAAGVVMQNEDVKVTSCRVRHPPITEAYAYRFDAKDRSMVISGDTAYAPELARFAKGADVLVHEAMYVPAIELLVKRAPNASRLREHLLASHTSTEDVGRIAAEAGVKTLVLSHLIPGDDPSISDAQWSEGARKYFKGRVIVGKDLMEI
jgi:ribonuclease BN (tRNA processing enzyme)